MNYKIEYYTKNDFSLIEKEWRLLEKGSDMTIFQSYEWNKMLVNCQLPYDTYYFESVFVVVRQDSSAILIAPLWIVKHTFRLVNKKGIYFVGREGWSDYLNCIYNMFCSDAFAFLLNELKHKYKIKLFVFEQVKETTELYRYIVSSQRVFSDEVVLSVSLKLPSSFDEYMSMLSKNSRQNIRTAGNRALKDGIELTYNLDDNTVDKADCFNIRQQKLSQKYDKVSLFRKSKYRLMNKLRFHFQSYVPMFDYPESKIMTAWAGSDLCAFFNYVFDEYRQTVLILAAGTNLTYARYSPGILLMYNYILSHLGTNAIEYIDFTRGDEKYKVALGGTRNNNHNVIFYIRNNVEK